MTSADADGVRPLVFMSHSGYEGEVKAVLQALARALQESGFIPLLDRETISGGTDFHRRVHSMIATCHAAVVVVNRGALELESTWVFNEASRLQERAESDQFFQVLPLYTDGLQPRDLINSTWDPTGLGRRHPVVMTGTPAAAAQQIVALLGETRERVAAGVVERTVARTLRRHVKEADLDGAAQMLTRESISGDPYAGVAKLLVNATHYTPVRNFLRELAITDYFEAASDVMRLVLPFMWVHPESVSSVPAAIAEGRPVGINSSKPKTTRAYVHCASTTWPIWRVFDVGVGFDGELVQNLLLEARNQLAYDNGEVEFDAPVTAEAAPEEDERRPLVILAVECSYFDPEIVDRIQALVANRPKIGLILQGGDVTSSEVPEALRERIVYLEPELDRGMETHALLLMEKQPAELQAFYNDHLHSRRGP